MFQRLTRLSVRMVERWLPDSYVFVLVFTALAALGALVVKGTPPLALVRIWGGGFWALLGFSMQMVLVLVTGFILARTPPMARLLRWLGTRCSTPRGAVVLVTLVSIAANWINWGFGLVVGALLAREVARAVRVDYRLLVASAYGGFIVWHGGLSGSIPLTVATPGHPFEPAIGLMPASATLFSTFNIAIVLALAVVVPLLTRAMTPKPEDTVPFVPPAEAEPEARADATASSPADRLERHWLLSMLVGVPGLVFLGLHFAGGGGLNLDIVNFAFLMLGIVGHRTPARLLAALREAIPGAAGIVVQFPFYAGIMAILVQSGLATTISQGFASFATAQSLPFWTFLSAGLVNMFIPSGGGQWAVQAPVMIPAAQALGADLPHVVMAIAWGDAWTNLLQPFFALPLLAIAGLRIRDIMGYCLMLLLATGAVIALGLTFV
ncbi:short-chain fatty acid transporter [Coralloluteibacterium stylophorae]|uniref:Short-chain fatty acid transporter n=1 Tax=Coralloluteibacterium stylophorae TaxID=1776034 RepID=A0A8J7VYR1_9GAMM|nr:TIGR00366 family protein [Coralloluteibacterium stylophorae]MBS7458413.1 short-chain fatty acid transporter [Coralloluteibacterium stylophorae]